MPRERRPRAKVRAESAESELDTNSNDRHTNPASQPGSPSKRKRKTPQSAQNSPGLPDLIPPPPSDHGGTIVAGNPFDDTPGHQLAPPAQQQLSHFQQQQQHQQQHQQQQQRLLFQQQQQQQAQLPPHQQPLQHPGHPQNYGPYSQFPPRPGMHQKHPGPPMPPPMPPGSGKIYPPNQPMVFNQSNPNAPPIYPCGVCHKEVHDNDQAILCESGCNFWFHRICSGLTEGAYHMLTQEVYAEWVCDKCLHSKTIPLVKMKP